MARFLVALMIFVALFAIVAIYRDWLTVGVTQRDQGPSVNVNINRDRFKEDFTSLKERVQGIAPQEIRGRLAAVDVARGAVTVQNDAGTLNLDVGSGTTIRVGARDGSLADLRPGMQVVAKYTAHGERMAAQSITAETPDRVGSASD